MKRLLRDFRVLPVVIFAAACLLVLKLVGLTVDGRYIFSPFGESEPQATGNAVSSIETKTAAPVPRRQPAQEALNFPETTGSSAAPKPPDGAADAAGDKAKGDKSIPPPKGPPDGKVIPLDGSRQLSPGERAVLERLQERRQELDARARELEIRENLLKAAEKRLEAKADEIKKSEGAALPPIRERRRQRPLGQKHRHDVRKHEAERCGQDLRPPRYESLDQSLHSSIREKCPT